MVNLTPTISLLELIYSLQAIAGIAVTAWAAWDGWTDYRASRIGYRRGLISAQDNRDNLKTALIGILAAIGGLISHSLFLILGALGMATPPPPPDRIVVANAFALGFVSMQSAMLACQIGVQMLRRSLRHPAAQLRDLGAH